MVFLTIVICDYIIVSLPVTQFRKDGKGFSSRNIRYMAKFYQLYRDDSNLPQLVANLSAEELCSVPWGHHRMIIDRCKGDSNKAAFFVRKTIQNNWSRAVLETMFRWKRFGKWS